MASGEPSAEETPSPTPSPIVKRKRKLNVRLGDLGESKPSSKGGRARKSTSPGTGDLTETLDSGTNLGKRVRTNPPVDNSGTENETETPDSGANLSKQAPVVDNSENQKKTPNSESKSRKSRKRISIETTANNSGMEKQLKTPSSGSKRASTKTPKDNSGAENQKKTPDSKSKGPKRPKRTSTKTTANNSAEYNQGTNQNGGAGLAEMGGIHGWLNRLGLGRYAQVFDKHEVDVEVLPIITLDDLREMGISAVGAKRKLYDAIQKLKEGL